MFKKHREPRVSKAFMVRINEGVSAQNPGWNIVMAQNISASGILFNFDHHLAPGAQIQFKISLPSGAEIECNAQVVRNVTTGASRGLGSPEQAVSAVAAVFQRLAQNDRKILREFIQQNLPSSGSVKGRPAPSLMSQSGKKQRAKRIDRSYVTQILRERSSEWELVTIRNISASGILFNYSRAMEVGHKLSFSMTLPFSASPVVCRGKVVRVKDETRSGAAIQTYAIGAAFSGLDGAMSKGLRQYGEQIGRD